jgi:hypothetical protein
LESARFFRRSVFDQTDRSSNEPLGRLEPGGGCPGASVIGGRLPDDPPVEPPEADEDGVGARAAVEAGMGRTAGIGILPRAALENAANELFEIMRRTVPSND